MAILVRLPCVLFEDDHLLVVSKPARLCTHAPNPWTGQGLYEHLRHREARWEGLAIIHRLDKDTSGILIFAKTKLANRSLTEQFATRQVTKKYLLVTDRAVRQQRWEARSNIARVGSQYESRPGSEGGRMAVTHFRRLDDSSMGEAILKGAHRLRHPPTVLEAIPVTGRSHQVRVHAAELGFPILGDAFYGGTAAQRLYLHASSLSVCHPQSGAPHVFTAPADFLCPTWRGLREALIASDETEGCRWIHGMGDGWPGWYVDQLGPFLLSQSETPLTREQRRMLEHWWSGTPARAGASRWMSPRGVYHKTRRRHVGTAPRTTASPQHLAGDAAPPRFRIRENGLQFEVSFEEGYSVGLFLDQRENRRRLVTNQVAAGFPLFPGGAPGHNILNTFAYTCAFSVCAASAGATTTNLDLSRKYLDWGKANFALNGLDPTRHDFLYGDVFDWMKRLTRKGRRFEVVILDPPTFSHSKQSGAFRAEGDYASLVRAALPLLQPGGVLLACTNAATLHPQPFLDLIQRAAVDLGRRCSQSFCAPQPLDYPVHRQQPPHLKSAWLRVE